MPKDSSGIEIPLIFDLTLNLSRPQRGVDFLDYIS